MITRTAAATAARILDLRINDAIRNSRPLPEGGVYFWDPSGRAGSVTVADDGTALSVSPTISAEGDPGGPPAGHCRAVLDPDSGARAAA